MGQISITVVTEITRHDRKYELEGTLSIKFKPKSYLFIITVLLTLFLNQSGTEENAS